MAITVVALLDGTLIDPAQPIVRADDLGVVRGDGVFDALLAVGGEARDLDAHLERLASSATLLDLPTPDEAGFRRAVDAILASWDWSAEPEAVLRMIYTRGAEGIEDPSGWVMAAPLDAGAKRQRTEGVRVLLLDRGFDGGQIVDVADEIAINAEFRQEISKRVDGRTIQIHWRAGRLQTTERQSRTIEGKIEKRK